VVSLLNATAQSLNCAFIRLAHEVGLDNVIGTAKSLGITANLPQFPSIVIGSIAVHPIEMAAAYAAVADDGVYHAPTFIDHIVDRSGATIYHGTDPGHRVLSSQVAREATVALQAVVQSGTGTGASLYNRPAAGKTGTTNNNVDAWFNGFTPQLETTVWMGNLGGEVPMLNVGGVGQVYGGTFPAHTWRDFMSTALNGQAVVGFTPPNSGELPAPKFITSPSLVHDDALDHNFGGSIPSPGSNNFNNFNNYNGSNSGLTPSTGSPTTQSPSSTLAPQTTATPTTQATATTVQRKRGH
jgi:penicillin-binding protein 1A